MMLNVPIKKPIVHPKHTTSIKFCTSVIVDRAVKPILDRSEVYSGCYARVSLNFYAFNSNGNKGIACGAVVLFALMK